MAEINYNNGDKYIGEEVNGFRNGFGKYTFSDGSFYEGEYVKDKMEGWGTFSWANNGDLYVGEWEDDAENGQGTAGAETFDRPAGEKQAFLDVGPVPILRRICSILRCWTRKQIVGDTVPAM